MSQKLICPQCQQSFDDDEYCPQHGARLVPQASMFAGTNASSETSAPASDEAPVQREAGGALGKLANFFRKTGARRVADKEILAADTTTAEESSPLPLEVVEKGWRITGPVVNRTGTDLWPVEGMDDRSGVVTGYFHRFRIGALTPPALYYRCEDMERTPLPQLALVRAHGTVNFGEARSDFELVSLPKTGHSLTAWLQGSTPSEQRAWHLLPLLVGLLGSLVDVQLRPLSLEPTWLQYTDDGELWLATAAALADDSTTPVYRTEFTSNPLLAHAFSAPELTLQNIQSPNAVVFSVGQLLAQAVWGQPRSLDEVQSGAVPFQTLADARLARVLMGCLWPRGNGRWTIKQLLQAAACDRVAAMPVTPPWASLAPGAASQSFAFAGGAYWRLEELLSSANKPAHWDEAITRIKAILDWAEDTAWAGQVALMHKALANQKSSDWVLVALTRAVLPETPPTWRTLDLSNAEAAASLAGLAQRALKGSAADATTMRALFGADLRCAFNNDNNS